MRGLASVLIAVALSGALEARDRVPAPSATELSPSTSPRELTYARSLAAALNTFPTRVSKLRQRFEVCRGVIGFRLHAGLLGLGLGKPAIAVGIDWRSLGFIETFSLQGISCRSRRPGQFKKLRRLTRLLLEGDAALLRQLDQAKSEGRRRENEFLSDAASRFRERASSQAG